MRRSRELLKDVFVLASTDLRNIDAINIRSNSPRDDSFDDGQARENTRKLVGANEEWPLRK
jgi:hypothetical protein